MRVFAAVVLGADTAEDVVTATGLSPRAVASALRRLIHGELIGTGRGGLDPHLEVFKEAMRGRATLPDEPLDPDRARASVLRAFIADGRLVSFPAARSKRRVVLEHIVASFEPGVRYSEREVDAILRAWHDDHAALRRYLVDEDLVARDKGVYWRIGGAG